MPLKFFQKLLIVFVPGFDSYQILIDDFTLFSGSSFMHQMFPSTHRITTTPTTPPYDPLLRNFTPEQSAHHAALLAVREHLPTSGITRR